MPAPASTTAPTPPPTGAPEGPLAALARRGLGAVVRDRLAERALFGDTRSWLLDQYHRLLARGVPGPGRRRLVRLKMRGLSRPVHARLGTSDLAVLMEMFKEREYDAALPLLRGGAPVVVDLGANIGLSVRVWLEASAGARIVAVEPDEGNMRVARLNVAAAGPGAEGRVTLVRACIGARPRRVRLERPAGGDQGWAFRMSDAAGDAEGGGEVDVVTMETLLERAGITGEIDLLKCDIEGGERELFGACAGWIGRVRAMIVEVHGSYTQADLEADLAAAGASMRARVLKDGGGFRVVLMTRAEGV